MAKNFKYLQGLSLQDVYASTVKSILDYGIARLQEEATHLTRDEIVKLIADACPLVSNAYKPGSAGPDYSTWERQLAYVFVQAMANATAFELAFKTFKQLDSGIRSRGVDSYSVCAVGGGPGTEMLGLTKLLITTYQDEQFAVRFAFADRQKSWGWLRLQMLSLVQEILNAANTAHTISHNGAYEYDLLSERGVDKLGAVIESVDLFVFNYVISENKHNFPQVERALQQIISRAKNGCHFLIIDRLESDGWLKDEIKRIFQCNLLTEGHFAYKYRNSVSDNKDVLRDYRRSFGYNPRMRVHTKEGDYGAFSVFGKKGEEDIPF